MTDGVTPEAPSGTPQADLSALPAGAVPSPEYAAEKLGAQLTDPNPTVKPDANPRPANVPEKFWDPDKGQVRVDDVLKSYAELSAKLGAPKEEAKADAPGDQKAPEGDPKVKIERPDGTPSPLASAIEEVAKAYSENSGQIADEQIESLEKLGLPRNVIDTYFAGLKAQESLVAQEVYSVAGGQEKFAAATEWAKGALSDDDLAYYNANIDVPATRRQTVEWLMAKFSAARPSEGALVGGVVPNTGAGDVFASEVQVTQAMSDPRYKTDPAYRKTVAEKLLRSRQAGTLVSTAEYHKRT